MLFYSILFISFFLLAFIIRVFRSVFYALAEHSVALLDQLISDADEEAKIKLVQKGTHALLLSLLKMLLVILLALAMGSIPLLLYCLVSSTAFSDLVFGSFFSILAISLGASVPFILPYSRKQNTDYSELSRLLHRIALNNYNIAYRLFQKEKRKISRKKLERRQDFVIISGLARAGTTSLMNDLSKISDFRTLNYANMPFLLCPNFWSKIYRPKSNKLKERSHKDGIMIGLNSNEAFEEFFFKVKAKDAYIKDSHLSEYLISKDDYEDYLDYQSIIMLDNRKVYLAKNNNYMLRYGSVREFNDDFIMIILYREPLRHAASLMEKHYEYLKLQKDDPFVLEYMNWLGHHEFGGNQKSLRFENTEEYNPDDKSTLDHWLKIWINYYSRILSISHPNTLLINYDSYCKNPKETVEAILRLTGIEADLPDYTPFNKQRRVDHTYSREVYKSAQEIYRRLSAP